MYSADGIQSKNDLVAQFAPLVKRVAYHLVGRLPASVMVEDLIQAGMLGLLDAAHHYDQSQGASFETYATIRVRGAMIDELRRNDWAPKSVHKRARDVAQAVQQVEQESGHDATDQEVAAALGVSLDEYHRILLDTSTSRFVSIEDLGVDEAVLSAPQGGEQPAHEVAQAQFRNRLSEAIAGLPERERMILALYYDKAFNLREIGAILKVSESRVSQLMSQAHTRLRGRLQDFN